MVDVTLFIDQNVVILASYCFQKTFTMNPNANVFRSIYHQDESLPGDSQPVSTGSFTQENKSFSSAIQNDFQGKIANTWDLYCFPSWHAYNNLNL